MGIDKAAATAGTTHLSAKSPQRRPPQAYLRIQTRRALDEVVLQIRDQLARGALAPGDRLPSERELAAQFQLSRNTVREALRLLEMSGLLEFRKGVHGGAFVREAHSGAVVAGFSDLFRLGMFQPKHLKDARLLISVHVVREACKRATAEDLEELEQNLDLGEAAVARGDTAERVRLGLEFHCLLAKASANPIMVILMESLLAIQRQMIELLGPSPDSLIMPARRRIFNYVAAKDEENAVLEMERNIAALDKHYLSRRSKLTGKSRKAKGPAQKRQSRDT
jgi:GntR family transcriptional repressor for pyruvate dehydrogenase complex